MPLESRKRGSSLRCVPALTTLSRARLWMDRCGISRLTDITRLDRLGLPVFAAVRPRAQSDAVTYGKGMVAIDAQVGACMEAIEFHYAEPFTSEVVTRWSTPREVAGTERHADAVLDFSPLLNKRIDLDGSMLLAAAHDAENGCEQWVPAELVFHPAPAVGQAVFGSSTNGLASGNSVLEASLHGLAEVIERDIWSFELIVDAARTVDVETLPAGVGAVIRRVREQGLALAIREVPNAYGLPFFHACLYEPGRASRRFFNGGWGCHLYKDIALRRAFCEAAQSRLAAIHGGRDFGAAADAVDRNFESRVDAFLSKPAQTVAYADITDQPFQSGLEQQWRLLVGCLRRVTDRPVYRVVYTPPDAPLHVVRIVVPTLEHFKANQKRAGRRFRAALEAV